MLRRLPLAAIPLALVLLGAPPSAPAQDTAPAASDPTVEALRGLSEQMRLLRVEMNALRKELRAAGQRTAPTNTVQPSAAPSAAAVTLTFVDDDMSMGSDEATVGIVEYSDFECPFCNRFHQRTLPQLKAEYLDTGKVRYVFRDFPLSFHRNARPAHVAARCAGEQGKFWEMHHALFLNQKRLNRELFEARAQGLGLDVPTFTACLENPASDAPVASNLGSGDKLGVRGTPTFFIGRIEGDKLVDAVKISGAQPFGRFSAKIEPLLR